MGAQWVWILVFISNGFLFAGDLKKHRVEVNQHAFALWEFRGAKADQAVLLLHGRTWSALPDFHLQVPGEDLSLMKALANRGFAVYALDMRGYGATERDESGWLSPNKAADDVAGVIQWINAHAGVPGKTAVLGWSMGSTTSQLAVQRHPGHVSSLILYGYWFNPDRPPKQADDPEKPAREKNTAKNAASDFITPGSISDKAVNAYVEACLAADPVRVDWRRLHQYAALDASKLTIPVMLIHGKDDPFVNLKAHEKVFSALTRADRAWVILTGGDHAVSLEKPMPRFVDAVASFMKREP